MAVTVVVLTANPALVWPAGTFTWPGGTAYALLLERVTLRPPAGAALVRLTVQLVLAPPVSVLGVQVTEETVGCAAAARPRVKVLELPFKLAMMVDEVVDGTGFGAVTANVLLLPDVMVTGETTVA
ncbi:MAG TPA: hypothetical protein VLX58_05265 [Bryobacteraceae bacterium]|nr:hypothetical protein [Bryobacteraceae bacterium]